MSANLITFRRPGIVCNDCHGKNDCQFLPIANLGQTETSLGMESKTLRRGASLIRQEDKATSLFVVKSGSFKSYFVNHDGTEQISTFHFPGDLIGEDALNSGYHRNNTAALETAAACEFPVEAFTKEATGSSEAISLLVQRLSSLIADREAHSFVLANYSAKTKLAWFLFELSEKLKARNLNSTTITLSMSRHDIANYLAMAVETVSRIFSDFESEETLLVDRKIIKVLSPSALAAQGNITSPPPMQVPRARMH